MYRIVILPALLVLAVTALSPGNIDFDILHLAHAASATLVAPMNDTVSSFGLSADSTRQIQAEYVPGTSSSLAGKSIDTIVVELKKVGLPSGPVQVGVFSADLSAKKLFGTIDASSIGTASYASYSFSLPAPQTYQIQPGDRIGIQFTGGDASNLIGIMTDQANSFDGTNSYLAYYTTAWQNLTGADLTMALQLHVAGLTVAASPPGGTYTSAQSVTLAASAPSVIFYTADGSTPTTSSNSGTSPLSGITVSTNSTLQFFAKDNFGNTSPVVSSTYTIMRPPNLSLLFVQHPSAADAPKVISLMHQYLTSPTDYIRVDPTDLYKEFPSQRKLMVSSSFSTLHDRIVQSGTIGVPIYAIAYDFEHWAKTPASEQADPLGSMITASDTVHAAGYKFAYAPDSNFLNDNYKVYDWKKVDVAWLQVGFKARLYSKFVPYITDVIGTIKTKNPNCTIIVQLSLAVMQDPAYPNPVSQYDVEVDKTSSLKADAISVNYEDPSASPNYTIPNLKAILSHIATFRQ